MLKGGEDRSGPSALRSPLTPVTPSPEQHSRDGVLPRQHSMPDCAAAIALGAACLASATLPPSPACGGAVLACRARCVGGETRHGRPQLPLTKEGKRELAAKFG